MKYRSYTMRNIKEISQMRDFSPKLLKDIELVNRIYSFQTNNYVVEKLIDWNNFYNDPMYIMNFPQRDMLSSEHLEMLETHSDPEIITTIRKQLNPHPGGQLDLNAVRVNGETHPGIQHKYNETVLFFPTEGQNCYAHCTFCFRWPQLIYNNHTIGTNDINSLIKYLQKHERVTDVLITGGDPLTMSAKQLEKYIKPLISANLPNLTTIRIGTKTLSYWPFRFLSDPDTNNLLKLFEKVTVGRDIHLSLMANFSHLNELETPEIEWAIRTLRDIGVGIRTQTPLLRHVNDDVQMWTKMLTKQVKFGMVPYYMFVVRDTGTQKYFSIPLLEAFKFYKNVYKNLPGLARTIRGPVMSTTYGKIEIIGLTKIESRRNFVLRFIQARNPEWIDKIFYARRDKAATWIDTLRPDFTNDKKNFFFENENLEKLSKP